MDEETVAIEITKLKSEVEILKESKRSWDNLVKDSIINTVKWLTLAGLAGVLSGWRMTADMRKWLTENLMR